MVNTRLCLVTWFVINLVYLVVICIITKVFLLGILPNLLYIGCLYYSNIRLKWIGFVVHIACVIWGVVLLIFINIGYASQMEFNTDFIILFVLYLVITIVYSVGSCLAVILFKKHIDAATSMKMSNITIPAIQDVTEASVGIPHDGEAISK